MGAETEKGGGGGGGGGVRETISYLGGNADRDKGRVLERAGTGERDDYLF